MYHKKYILISRFKYFIILLFQISIYYAFPKSIARFWWVFFLSVCPLPLIVSLICVADLSCFHLLSESLNSFSHVVSQRFRERLQSGKGVHILLRYLGRKKSLQENEGLKILSHRFWSSFIFMSTNCFMKSCLTH